MIKVSGMSCVNCEKKVKETLRSIGLRRVKIDLETGNVSFKNRKDIPLEAIKEKIEERWKSVV